MVTNMSEWADNAIRAIGEPVCHESVRGRLSEGMRRIGRLASGAVSPPPAVAECLGSLKGDACTYEDVVAVRNNSRIHRARWGSRTIAVKECFGGTQMRPNPAAAEREFTALTSLAESNSAPGAQSLAPLPLSLCREHAVYTMTWARGRPATEVILSRTPRWTRRGMGKSAGHWRDVSRITTAACAAERLCNEGAVCRAAFRG